MNLQARAEFHVIEVEPTSTLMRLLGMLLFLQWKITNRISCLLSWFHSQILVEMYLLYQWVLHYLNNNSLVVMLFKDPPIFFLGKGFVGQTFFSFLRGRIKMRLPLQSKSIELSLPVGWEGVLKEFIVSNLSEHRGWVQLELGQMFHILNSSF